MSWLEDFMNEYAKHGLLGVGWFSRDGYREVCLNARVNGVQMPVVATCDTPERAADIAEALNFVTRIGMSQRRNPNVGNTLQDPNVGNTLQDPNVGNTLQDPNVGNSQEWLDDIDGSRRDWSKEVFDQKLPREEFIPLSNVGQQADGFRETELSNIGFEDVDFQRDSCVHEIPYRYFCPICDGGYECDGHHCPEGPHDHYV